MPYAPTDLAASASTATAIFDAAGGMLHQATAPERGKKE